MASRLGESDCDQDHHDQGRKRNRPEEGKSVVPKDHLGENEDDGPYCTNDRKLPVEGVRFCFGHGEILRPADALKTAL